eukprot:1362257-Amphidinium_carterae.2
MKSKRMLGRSEVVTHSISQALWGVVPRLIPKVKVTAQRTYEEALRTSCQHSENTHYMKAN